MRNKFHVLFYTCLSLVLLTALLAPVFPVSAGTLAWSPVTTPNVSNGQLYANTDVDVFVIAPDGTTMFAYDNTTCTLYKSSDSGYSWTTTGIGATLNGNVVVAMVLSPDYANDKTVFAAASTTKVFRSIDGGKTFGNITFNLTGLPVDWPPVKVITSLAYSPSYQGEARILVSARDGAHGGGVYSFSMATLTWNDLKAGDWNGDGAVEDPCDVLAVAFSPNVQTDTGVLAVVTHSAAIDTRLTSKFGSAAWGSTVSDAVLFAQEADTAVIAFPSDYDWSLSNHVLVGTSGTTSTSDDVFLVNGAVVGSTSLVYDLEANGTAETEVRSMSIKGALNEAKVLVSQKTLAAPSVVKSAEDIYPGGVTWADSSKLPTGDTCTTVAWSPASDDAYAATSGSASALSRSTDSGVTWNQVGLIDISAASNLAITDIAAVDDKTMFLLMWDDATAANIYNTGDYTMVFKTTDGGTTWERVWTHRTSTAEAMTILKLSPMYAKDKTLFVAQNDNRIWKTGDEGVTFSGLTAPAPVTALAVVDQKTYYTGHADAIYKSNRWTAAALEGNTAKSIVVAADGSAIFVGTNNGNVFTSTDDAKTFKLLTSAQSLGVNADITLALDFSYVSSKTIFAGSSDATAGVSRWVMGQSTTWQRIDNDGSSLTCTGLVISGAGALYAASNTLNKGVRRIIAPKEELANINPESVIIDLPANARITRLISIPGSNVLLAIAGNVTAGSYGYPFRLLAFDDTLVVALELVEPADKTNTPEVFALVWKPIDSPVILTYRYQVVTDSAFTSFMIGGTTSGNTVNLANLPRGMQYWWRVFVDIGGPLRSKTSAVWTFNVELPAPAIMYPAYGGTDVSLRPTFSWMPVPGATEYEIELADNLEYNNARVQQKLTHTVWTWDKDLSNAKSYYWRVRAVVSRENGLTNNSRWTDAVFTTKVKPPVSQPPVIIDTLKPSPPGVVNVPPITVDIPLAQPPPPSNISPFQIRVIIVIYSILFLAIIALVAKSGRQRPF